ncbi:hypothetical protein E2562_018291 [Oryza meyeriana var. granulata]|uniref:UBN2 domain-containing protein n=1 Tax=Oryza meyeriana var. granulata TaxID=110450 RepID=A0A6G1CSU6_9ORYZ|nr:hypothetical protein E2562_018291 [Oryza meyeriana var. granulata]
MSEQVKYETFVMLPDKSVNDMYGRLNVIVNEIKGLGESYTDLEIAQKMLRALPSKYETLVTFLINSNMSRMTPAALLRKININDMYKAKKQELEEASPSSKKIIALKTEVEDKGKLRIDEDKSDDLDDEIALLAKRFNKGRCASNCPNKEKEEDKSSSKKSVKEKLFKRLKKKGKKIEAFFRKWNSNDESSEAQSFSSDDCDEEKATKKNSMAGHIYFL